MLKCMCIYFKKLIVHVCISRALRRFYCVSKWIMSILAFWPLLVVCSKKGGIGTRAAVIVALLHRNSIAI